MKQFALLIKENAEVIPNQEDIEDMERAYIKWMDELIAADNYITGHRLNQGRETLEPNGDIITDGPYVEIKEMIGGIVIIKAKDMQEAMSLTKKCPMHNIHAIDLREVSYGYTI